MSSLRANDGCFGCFVRGDMDAANPNSCEYYNRDSSCPCTNCLVKITCDICTGDCEPYETWYENKTREERQRRIDKGSKAIKTQS